MGLKNLSLPIEVRLGLLYYTTHYLPYIWLKIAVVVYYEQPFVLQLLVNYPCKYNYELIKYFKENSLYMNLYFLQNLFSYNINSSEKKIDFYGGMTQLVEWMLCK